jgi:hypothetical protein
MPPPIIGLTDTQLAILRTAAEPLHPRLRGAFLNTVAELLAGQEIGDGAVSRTAAVAQKRYRDPPRMD